MCGFPAAHLPHFQTRPRRQKGITTERFSSIPFSSCCSILSCHPSCQTDLPSGPRPLVESLPSRRSRSLDRRRQPPRRSEEHTSELQSHSDLVCRLLLEHKKAS